MTKTNTFREHLQGAILETCDLWDIWSEWWGDMTWPTKRQRQRQRQIHLESTFKAILETCDLWDIWSELWGDLTWPKNWKWQRQWEIHLESKYKDKKMTKTNTLRAPSKSDPSDLWHLRHWLQLRQLRNWSHENICYLTIKNDTGQHSQFLWCFWYNNKFWPEFQITIIQTASQEADI